MRRETLGIVFVAAAAVFMAATCRTTKTVVARLVTPTPAPAAPPAPAASPVAAAPSARERPSATATPMRVVTSASSSIYDRTPGVLYEQSAAPTRTATQPRASAEPSLPAPSAPLATATPVRPKLSSPTPPPPTSQPQVRQTAIPTVEPATPTPRPRPSPPPTETAPPPRSTPPPPPSVSAAAPSQDRPGRPTPTHKPGAYYEPSDYRPAVTWTPTPDKRR